VCYDCVIDSDHFLHYVGSYEEWVDNLETKPVVCPLTGKILTPDDDVIRFKNMQIFLMSAIDEYGKSKPPNTPLTDFTIPNTKELMVPPPEDQTKIANYIREKLKVFLWIRDQINQESVAPQTITTDKSKALFAEPIVKIEGLTDSGNAVDPLALPVGIASRKTATGKPRVVSAEHTHDPVIESHSSKTPFSPPRRFPTDMDDEDEKYKRRTIDMDALGFTNTNRNSTTAQRYRITGKRLLLFLALILTLFIVILLSVNMDEITAKSIFADSQNETLPAL